jgi:hypothetical protein
MTKMGGHVAPLGWEHISFTGHLGQVGLSIHKDANRHDTDLGSRCYARHLAWCGTLKIGPVTI